MTEITSVILLQRTDYTHPILLLKLFNHNLFCCTIPKKNYFYRIWIKMPHCNKLPIHESVFVFVSLAVSFWQPVTSACHTRVARLSSVPFIFLIFVLPPLRKADCLKLFNYTCWRRSCLTFSSFLHQREQDGRASLLRSERTEVLLDGKTYLNRSLLNIAKWLYESKSWCLFEEAFSDENWHKKKVFGLLMTLSYYHILFYGLLWLSG